MALFVARLEGFMKFDDLLEGRLVKRYKRFLADISLPDGEVITVHCPNTGAMTGCAEPGCRVWLSCSDNPKRKYVHTWELVEPGPKVLASVHSAKANHLVLEALQGGIIKELNGFDKISREVRFGNEKSRVDLMLSFKGRPCYIEVKSVTLDMGGGIGMFPDAVSTRGSKHLRELIWARDEGYRSVLLFCVQHDGISEVRPADHIDSVYGATLRDAIRAGVEVLAYKTEISTEEIRLLHAVPFSC